MPVVKTKGVAIGFELVPDVDQAQAVFTSFKNGTSKAGKDKATAIFTILKPKELEGRTVPKSYSFEPNALFGWKGDMVKLGIDPEALEDEATDTDEVMKDVVGTKCLIKVGHYTFEGKTYNNLEIIDEDSFAQPAT